MNPALAAKIRRESMRWMILESIYENRPVGMHTEALLPIIRSVYRDTTHLEIRQELDYLQERELVAIEIDPMDNWFVNLNRYGTDIVEYTCECDPGISRPNLTRV